MCSHIRRVMAIAYCVAAIGGADTALAVVQTTGNVLLSPDFSVMDGAYTGLYADNPLTTTVNEGIPTNGNRIDPFRLIGSQVEFEGQVDPTNPNQNRNFSVIVGRTSFGELIINQSQLRDLDLVIGDQGTATPLQRGTGVVRIEGFGSLYNNNPLLQPFVSDGSTTNVDAPIKISAIERPVNPQGYDMYVGRFGNGTLQLALGGRAEIQDSVIAGDQSGSVGTIVIDGIDSFLQSGGFEQAQQDDIVNYMVVGRLGSGTMHIRNGGQSYNQGLTVPTGGATDDIFGAVIGSNLAAVTTTAPGAGGNGTVIVDGAASKWTIAGNFQIGGFHNNRIGIGPAAEDDLEGNTAIYGSGVGRGLLNVSNGALVSIVTPPLEDPSNAPDTLDMLVGRFGRIQLDTGGRIELLGAFDSTSPTNPMQRVRRGRLINDGVVGGDGSISVLQFRNRVLGEVRVTAGESLTIEATGSYTLPDNVPLPAEDEEYPLSNYGVISVLGTETERAEIEFDREKLTPAPTIPPDVIGPPNRPFLNLPIPAAEPIAPNGRTEGLIHGEYSTMRFNSGLSNRGILAFTAGNNVVNGDVVNEARSAPGVNDDGYLIIGPNTNVAFEDDFIIENAANFSFTTTSTWQVLKGNSFSTAGTMSIEVGGSSQGLTFNKWQIGGNATISGILDVTISNGGLVPLGSAVTLFDFGGSVFGNFSEVIVNGSTDEYFTFARNGKFFLQSLSAAVANGPDLNGDGVVDSVDYAIWLQNFGDSGAPGTVVGDIDGNGVVDAADYTEWADECCGPFPGAGGGSGGLGGGFAGTVPEPTSALLLAFGSMLALACGRRRTV